MKTNILKNLRWAVCAALLAVGSTAFADTATSTFTGVTGSNGNFTFTQSSSSTAGVTWTSNAKKVEYKSSAVRVTQGQSDQYYIFGSVPSNWVITKITFESAVTNGTAIDLACYVNGVQFSAVSGASYSYEGNQLSNGTISITVPAHGSWGGNYMGFTGITIEYTTTVIPTITWPTTTTNYTSTSGIVIKFSCDMSIKNSSGEYLSINSADAFALVYGAFGVMDGTSAEDVAYTIVVNSKNQVTLTPTGVVDCSTYSAYVGEELVASNGYESVPTNGRDWEFTTVGENLVVTGKTSLLLNETFTPKTDLVVKADGVDVTSECTFTTINTATAGSQTLTITHGACTTTQVITVTERTPCTITWVNNVTGETLAQSTVYQGISLSESGLTTLPSPSTKVAETDCGTKSFVGWSKTQISGSTDEAPTLITTSSVPNAATYTFYAVYADGSSTSEGWKQISATSELSDLVGKQILIAYAAESKVMGKKQTDNYKPKDATIAADGTLTPEAGYTAVILGGSADAWTFKTDVGYLAPDGNKNKLRVQDAAEGRALWTISITSGSAKIVSNGESNYKNMKFNTNAKVFSCYKDGTADVKNVNLYYVISHSGYITSCNCTPLGTPSGLAKGTVDAESAVLNWSAVANATSYTVYYSTDQSTWSEATTTTNSVTITGLNKGVKYYWKVKAHADGKTYCVNSAESNLNNFTTNSSCTWRISIQEGSTWEENNCFTQVGTTDEWQYELTLPDANSNFWVGPASGFITGSSVTTTFSNITFAGLQNTECGKPYPGSGAVGAVRIYTNDGCTGKSSNYCIAFVPTYQIAFGVEGASAWSHVPFAYVNNTTYETDLTEIPSDYASAKFYVGAKNASNGTNYADGKSNTVLMTTMGGLNSGNMVGVKGKFRMYDNSCDYNWFCAFIPSYNVIYYNADNSTAFANSDYLSSEAMDKTITIISTSPEKKGYRFLGWSKTANSSTIDVAAGATYTLTKPNEALYPVYVQQVTLTYDANGGTSECGTPQYDINSTADLCTEVERTGYAFKGWSKAKDDATQIVTGSITMNANQTLYAIWEKCLTVTYFTSGLTLAGGCSATQTTDASGNTLVAGSKVTLCAKPTSNSGYTFVKWKVSMDGAETEYDASATVTLSADATVQATWDTPDITLNFFNQGGGVNNESRITVTVPLETYATAPTTTNVPQSCDGKQFIGWINAVLSEGDEDEKFSIDDETKYESVDDLTQAGFTFLSPGEKFMVTNTTPKTWYAVFGTPE